MPGITGRRTWVEIISWTPDSVFRVEQVEAPFAGRLSETEAPHPVRSSGATFLLSDCNHPADLALQLPSTVAPPVPSAVPRPTGSSPLERPDRADGQGTERRPPLCSDAICSTDMSKSPCLGPSDRSWATVRDGHPRRRPWSYAPSLFVVFAAIEKIGSDLVIMT